MNWIEIAWTMMAASSITLGSIHLFVWFTGELEKLTRRDASDQGDDRADS